MEALAANLRRRPSKLLEQQLSLPKIPEKTAYNPAQTAIRLRKARPPTKYVSETTLSPHQEHLHDQLRTVLQLENPPEPPRHPSPLPEPRLNKHLLPRINEPAPRSRREGSSSREEASESRVQRSRSLQAKFSIDSILQDKSSFIQDYFAELSLRAKR